MSNEAQRQQIIRIMNPDLFVEYDLLVEKGTLAENGKPWADVVFGFRIERLLEKADAILAALSPAATPASPELREQIKDTINRVVTVKERWDGLQILEGLDAAATAPQEQENELYRIRDLIASHIACEKDCQEMPSGCGCALAAARAVVTRPERAPE